jgi:hypothetical protein
MFCSKSVLLRMLLSKWNMHSNMHARIQLLVLEPCVLVLQLQRNNDQHRLCQRPLSFYIECYHKFDNFSLLMHKWLLYQWSVRRSL